MAILTLSLIVFTCKGFYQGFNNTRVVILLSVSQWLPTFWPLYASPWIFLTLTMSCCGRLAASASLDFPELVNLQLLVLCASDSSRSTSRFLIKSSKFQSVHQVCKGWSIPTDLFNFSWSQFLIPLSRGGFDRLHSLLWGRYGPPVYLLRWLSSFTGSSIFIPTIDSTGRGHSRKVLGSNLQNWSTNNSHPAGHSQPPHKDHGSLVKWSLFVICATPMESILSAS